MSETNGEIPQPNPKHEDVQAGVDKVVEQEQIRQAYESRMPENYLHPKQIEDIKYDTKPDTGGLKPDQEVRVWDYDANEWKNQALSELLGIAREKAGEPTLPREATEDFFKDKDGKPYSKEQAAAIAGFLDKYQQLTSGGYKRDQKMDTGSRHEMAWYKDTLDALDRLSGNSGNQPDTRTPIQKNNLSSF